MLPVSGAGGACSPRAARTAIVGSPFLAYLFWRSKRGRSAAGPRPGLYPRQGSRTASPASHTQHERLAFCNRRKGKGGFAAAIRWRMKRCRSACRTTRPGVRPGSRVTSLAFAKRSNQEKATPMMAVRAARGLHTLPAPKSGSVRNSLRSDNGRFFIRFRRQRRVAIDGDPQVKNNGNGNGNGNGRCAGHPTPQRQAAC